LPGIALLSLQKTKKRRPKRGSSAGLSGLNGRCDTPAITSPSRQHVRGISRDFVLKD
jgi:hypothetical protein